MKIKFNPTQDIQKIRFLELANRGEGFTRIEYIGCDEGNFDNIETQELTATKGYVRDLSSVGIVNEKNIDTETLTSINIVNEENIDTETITSINIINKDDIDTKRLTATESVLADNIKISANNIQDITAGAGGINISDINIKERTIKANNGNLELLAISTGSSEVRLTAAGNIRITTPEEIHLNGIISTTNDDLKVHKPMKFYDEDLEDYVCFLPQSGVQQTYKWPDPPSSAPAVYKWGSIPLVSIPMPAVGKVGPYLTFKEGELEWDSTSLLLPTPFGPFTIPSFITPGGEVLNTSELTMSEELEIEVKFTPPDEPVSFYTTSIYLTHSTLSDGSGYELSWESALLAIPAIPVPALKGHQIQINKFKQSFTGNNTVIINGQEFTIPEPFRSGDSK